MSRGPENRFIASIHRLLKGKLHFEKMNNPYRGGTADVWYSGREKDCWIEYKWLDRVPVRKCTPALEPLQREWLRGRTLEGRDVFVVVGCPAGGILFDSVVSWEKGLSASQIKIMPKNELAHWILAICGPTSEITNEKGSKRSARRKQFSDVGVQGTRNGIPALRVSKVPNEEKQCKRSYGRTTRRSKKERRSSSSPLRTQKTSSDSSSPPQPTASSREETES